MTLGRLRRKHFSKQQLADEVAITSERACCEKWALTCTIEMFPSPWGLHTSRKEERDRETAKLRRDRDTSDSDRENKEDAENGEDDDLAKRSEDVVQGGQDASGVQGPVELNKTGVYISN